MANDLYERCKTAIERLEACTEREVAEYGEADYQEVKEMESEAPAPTPCVDHFNEVIEALMAYDGDASEFNLGKNEKAIHATLKARQH